MWLLAWIFMFLAGGYGEIRRHIEIATKKSREMPSPLSCCSVLWFYNLLLITYGHCGHVTAIYLKTKRKEVKSISGGHFQEKASTYGFDCVAGCQRLGLLDFF